MKILNMKVDRLRILAALALTVLVFAGVKGQLSWGSICSYCPLGFLQITLAGRSIPVDLLLPVALVTVGIIFLGKAFCAWLCPAGLLKGIFKGKEDNSVSTKQCSGQCSSCNEINEGGSSYTTYIVLGVVLLASLIVKFPVFCLVCPVGLFFGFGYAVFRLSTLYQPGWELLIFPMILILEVFVLRSWCAAFCPLGAMFKIIGQIGMKTNIAIRPNVNQDVCLQNQGVNCQVCNNACPENLDMPISDKKGLEDCTLCLECYQDCPSEAIKISLTSKQTG